MTHARQRLGLCGCSGQFGGALRWISAPGPGYPPSAPRKTEVTPSSWRSFASIASRTGMNASCSPGAICKETLMRPPFTDSPVMQGDWPKIAPSGDCDRRDGPARLIKDVGIGNAHGRSSLQGTAPRGKRARPDIHNGAVLLGRRGRALACTCALHLFHPKRMVLFGPVFIHLARAHGIERAFHTDRADVDMSDHDSRQPSSDKRVNQLVELPIGERPGN